MKRSLLLLSIFLLKCLIISSAQNVWEQKTNFGGTGRSVAAGFSIGAKGYMGTGYDGTFRKDFWEYDPMTNVWTQKANFGGGARIYAVGLSIGNKGYMGLGSDSSGVTSYKNDFWQYDPETNSWKQKASFSGDARALACGFSISEKGYIGTGWYGYNLFKNDFWEYDPNTDIWTQKTAFGGAARQAAVGFSIGKKGYIGTGNNNTGYTKDFWEYDPSNNSWTKKADFGGSARAFGVGFALGNYGYLGTGEDASTIKSDFWRYDPLTNTWTEKSNYGGTIRTGTVGFALNGKGYVGTGHNGIAYFHDFWEYTAENPGTWIPFTYASPNPNNGVMLLLSDGNVMCKTSAGGNDGQGNKWDKLVPDNYGSYTNGKWFTSIPSMVDTRTYFSSQVLKDGRVYVAGGEYGSGIYRGEIYDPVANVWSSVKNPNSSNLISDANSEILENGKVLQALLFGTLKKTQVYDPLTNKWTSGPTCKGIHNESAWVKLPDNSILMVDRNSKNSERYIPSLNSWITDSQVPIDLYDPFGLETGAAILLPDGRAFFLGSLGHTAYYTPSGTTNPGVWTTGPDIPGGNGTPDAAAAMMFNGKILLVASPAPTLGDTFPSPTYFYEFDYTMNTFSRITAPDGSAYSNIPTYVANMLDLPDGSVLYSSQGSNLYYAYYSDGTAIAQGKPIIDDLTQPSCGMFKIFGNVFNGISEGAAYGDDWQIATNYPIIRLTNGTSVYYARTSTWNSTGVQRGNLSDTAQFSLPTNIANGTYSLEVVANGISSDPITFEIQIPVAKITPLGSLDICQTGQVDLKANAGIGYTYQWTKDGNILNSATSQIYTATSAGKYEVVVVNSLGFCKTSAGKKVYTSCKEFPESVDSLLTINVSPNPAISVTTIDLNIPQPSNVSLALYNLNGEKLKDLLNSELQKGHQDLRLDASQFTKGVYILKLVTNWGVRNQQLVIQ